MPHMRALNGAVHSQCDAAEVFGGHGLFLAIIFETSKKALSQTSPL